MTRLLQREYLQGRPNLGGNGASCVMDILGGKKKFCDLLYCIVNSVMFVS